MTTLAAEKLEQRKWVARLHRATPIFDKLLENEFQKPARHDASSAKTLSAMLRFAAKEVPYYREILRHSDADVTERDPTSLLASLPILTKLAVQDNNSKLLAEHLPAGETRGRWAKSSGTTGRPTQVLHTKSSDGMFGILKQREYRWFRFDPSGKFAVMREPAQLPRHADGRELAPGETLTGKVWPSVGGYFSTGPSAAISVRTPMEERIEWLRRERPDYLMIYAEGLEFMGIVAGAERPAESLKAVMAISEQLTPGMRAFVERRFGVPVHQNYGLNEIGIVAARCEAGRYHVHSEHCVVEIIDENGRASAPGETGRIIVTGLTNTAMPLLRYDTGDLAQAAAGECFCNRTLPSFGEIAGRYSRVAYLPDRSVAPFITLRDAIENMSVDLMHGLREFQIHQFRDRSIELRLVTRSPLAEGFYAHLQDVWANTAAETKHKLTFCIVDEIARSPGGKHNVFTSDFMPSPDDDAQKMASSGMDESGPIEA